MASAATPASTTPSATQAPPPQRAWQVEVDASTNLAVAVGPLTGQLAVTVQGGLWLVPPKGGQARPAVPPGFECMETCRPSWSPDELWLAFQTNQDGHYHLWRTAIPDGEPEPLTSGPQDDRDPSVSPDGQRIAFVSDRTGRYQVWVHDLRDDTFSQWSSEPGETAMPNWHPSGDAIAYVLDEHSVRVATADGSLTAFQDPDRRLFGPSFSPDGKRLSCVAIDDMTSALVVVDDGTGTRASHAEDVSPVAADWVSDTELVYGADGRVRRRCLEAGTVTDIPVAMQITGRSSDLKGDVDLFATPNGPVRGIVDPVQSPDGARVAFHALGSVWVGDLEGRPQALPGAPAHQDHPAWFPDGRLLVYSSDRAGSRDLWQFDTKSGEQLRLTSLEGAQMAPTVSPDGDRIAFQDHENKTFVLDTVNNSVRQVLPALMNPGRPSWTPAGRRLSLFAHVPASRSYREGESQLLLVDVETGVTQYASFAEHGALSGRSSGGPAWSPDGRLLAIVLDGQLHVVPVSPDGDVSGPPRRLTDHTADYPSWAPDSRTVLYVHHGEFRRVAAEDDAVDYAAVGRVGLELPRMEVTPPERRELHVGALWDGLAEGSVRDVRIVVEAGRIVSVEPGVPPSEANALPEGTRLTAIPGLVDMHHHLLDVTAYGRRLGLLNLAYGVTTIRTAGDAAYVSAATQETWASGAQLGPRYVPTGELLDGVRCVWALTRPVRDEEQLVREIERHHALGMRFVKIYNRLPPRWHSRVVQEAHGRGMRVTSHHLYPGVLHGQDGLEHLVVPTNRIHTLASRLGHTQDDVVDMITKSGLNLTPTIFDSSVLHFDDPSLVEDERLRTLLPEWAYQLLLKKASSIASVEPAAARQRLQRLVATIRRVLDRGGHVTTGTDVPLDDVGLAVHLNLRALVRGGVDPVVALRTATVNAAAALGSAHEIGAIRAGYLADIVFVQGDPTTRVEDAANVHAVMRGGRLYRRAELFEALSGPATADGTPVFRGLSFGSVPNQDSHWWHSQDTWNFGSPKQGQRPVPMVGPGHGACC